MLTEPEPKKSAEEFAITRSSHLSSLAGRIPPLYGLLKIHKPNVPLRPLVAFMHSPSYQLFRYLAQILSPLVGNLDSQTVNSKGFVFFAPAQKLALGDILVSFHVVLLFTMSTVGSESCVSLK